MARLVTYQCPDCGGSFDFLHHPSDEPPPSHCSLCGAYMGDEPQKVPVLKLNMKTYKSKVTDNLYRDMERASEARVEAAAEMAGVDKSEMSHLKITDMNDHLREGDVAAKTSDVVRKAEANLSYKVGGRTIRPELQNPQAAEWAGQTTSGDGALSTRQFIDQQQATGRMRTSVAQMTAAGRIKE